MQIIWTIFLFHHPSLLFLLDGWMSFQLMFHRLQYILNSHFFFLLSLLSLLMLTHPQFNIFSSILLVFHIIFAHLLIEFIYNPMRIKARLSFQFPIGVFKTKYRSIIIHFFIQFTFINKHLKPNL